jgi:hypothetical protein
VAARKVLLGIGAAAGLVAIVVGVCGVASADPDPTYDPLPPISNGLPTMFTPPNIYIVNGDGTRTDCVALDQALSCDWK